MAPPDASGTLRYGFVILTLIVASSAVWMVYFAGRGLREPPARTRKQTAWAATAVTAWLLLTDLVARSGAIADTDRRPPPLVLLLLSVVVVTIAVAFTGIGTRLVQGLPLWALVASQAFRLPLELLMHRAADEGVMPVQMSYSGLNFDIVTGITAIPVAWLLARMTRRRHTLALGWNVLGALLLVNILVVAMMSTPVFAAFGPDRLNTWVAYPPFVWLPTVMVASAITGHLLLFRKLRATATRRL